MGDLAKRTAAVGAKVMGGAPSPVQFGVSPDAQYMTDNPNRRCPDTAKLRAAFPQWSPKVSLDAGLERTLRSFFQAGHGKPL